MPKSDAGSDVVKPALSFFHPKPSGLVLHVLPNVCMGHAIRMWSAVCSAALHLQFNEGVRPHLCMDKWNHPSPIHRRLSLTQAVQGKLIPTDLALVLGIKTRSLEVFSQYSVFHLWFVHSEAQMQSPARLCERFCTASTTGHLDLSLSWQASKDPLKRLYKV